MQVYTNSMMKETFPRLNEKAALQSDSKTGGVFAKVASQQKKKILEKKL